MNWINKIKCLFGWHEWGQKDFIEFQYQLAVNGKHKGVNFVKFEVAKCKRCPAREDKLPMMTINFVKDTNLPV